MLSLQELCCRAIVARTTVYSIEQLPLPTCVKSHLKSYALTATRSQLRYTHSQRKGRKHPRFVSTPTSPGGERSSCVPRNSCTLSWYWCCVLWCKSVVDYFFKLLLRNSFFFWRCKSTILFVCCLTEGIINLYYREFSANVNFVI